VLLAVWIALGVGVAAALAATTLVVKRAFGAWRSLRRLARGTRDALAELEAKTTAGEQKATALARKSAATTAATARLEGSLATLAVLRAAAGETGAGVRRVRGLLPRK